MTIGYYSVVGDRNGEQIATGWDVLGTKEQGEALFAEAMESGLASSTYYKNLRLVMQFDEVGYSERFNPKGPLPTFRDVELGPMPRDDF